MEYAARDLSYYQPPVSLKLILHRPSHIFKRQAFEVQAKDFFQKKIIDYLQSIFDLVELFTVTLIKFHVAP